MNRVPHRVCEKCKAIFTTLLASYPAQPPEDTHTESLVWHNLRSLTLSVAIGCHLCILIHTEIGAEKFKCLQRTYGMGVNDAKLGVLVRLRATFNVGTISVDNPNEPVLEIEEPRVEGKTSLCELRIAILGDDAEQSRLTSPVAPSTCSWNTFNDLQYWIRECQHSHNRCRAKRQSRLESRLPTRLLFVDAYRTQSHIYLRESSSLPKETLYATLSHCWGVSGDQLRLLEENYKRFKGGILVADLPLTFRDAVAVVRALGISYLWIDSLCIIQAPSDDWMRESARMSNVYGGSFLNLAAADSADSSGGLFRSRNPLSVTPFRTKVSFAPAQWDGRICAVFPDGTRQDRVDCGLLSKRAWVVQERMLAPRTAHFTRHKILWECTDLAASESDVKGELDSYFGSPKLGWASVQTRNGLKVVDREAEILQFWDQVLPLYTAGQLTYDSDKLIAISGIAKYLQRLSSVADWKYYAGMWSYQIEWQLLWYTCSTGGRLATAYRAPSWSWASCDREIHRTEWSPKSQVRFLAQVLDIAVETALDFPFGSAVSGHLIIRGPLCRVRSITTTSARTGGQVQAQLQQPPRVVSFESFVFDDATRTSCHELYLLGVVVSLELYNVPISGLILEPTRAQRGQYKRVGYFNACNWPFENPQWEGDLEDEIFVLKMRTGPGGRLELPGRAGDLHPAPNRRCLEDSFGSMHLDVDRYRQRYMDTREYEIEIV